MEEMSTRLTFPAMFNETLRKFGKNNAYAFVGEEPLSYERVDNDIKALTAFLEKIGIGPGDKVAILSNNMPNWGVAFFSITFMGAVAVPVLPDFSNTEVSNVLEHSGVRQHLYLHLYFPELRVLNLMCSKQLSESRISPWSFQKMTPLNLILLQDL
jgi:long-chain acyl-CoA synthetase